MLESKYFERIAAVLMVVALLLAMAAMAWPERLEGLSQARAGLQYGDKLFGALPDGQEDPGRPDRVMEIDIAMDPDDWDEMIENKMTKAYHTCDLTVNGEEYRGVGIRTKGNSSLTSVQGERLSFRFDFDHYVYNQTCYGLRQMVVNNLQADATYMKDYVAYDLMAKMGVDAPLHKFAFLTLNGEPFGVYLAAEVYEQEYLERTGRPDNTQLYNVKSSGLDRYESAEIDPETGEVLSTDGYITPSGMGMGAPPGPPPDGMGPPGFPQQGGDQAPGGGQMPPGGAGGGMQPPQAPDGVDGQTAPPPPAGSDGGMQPPEAPDGADGQMAPPPPAGSDGGMQPPQAPDGGEQTPAAPDNGGMQPPPGPPGGMGGGGDLLYTDGNTESYANIFANAVFDTATAKDYGRLIRAIYVLNKEGVTREELERYWDVDEVLRYFAVHTFMVNSDSYTGNMLQNYTLAETDGRVSILPWDYNLSFGMMGGPPPGGGPGGQDQPGGQAPAEGQAPPGGQETGQQGFPPPPDMGGAGQAAEIVNLAIDTPVSGASMEDRPLLSVLLNLPECRETYHQYLQELIDYTGVSQAARDSGTLYSPFGQKLNALDAVLHPYIQEETVTFFTPEEHQTGMEALQQCIQQRSESIQKQLDGTLAAETENQDPAQMVQPTFSISDMGSMGGPGGPGGEGGPGGPGGPPPGPPPGGFGGMPPPPPPGGMPPRHGGTRGPGRNAAPAPRHGRPGRDAPAAPRRVPRRRGTADPDGRGGGRRSGGGSGCRHPAGLAV